MSDLPTLIVDGDPADWLFWHTKTRGGQSTVRVDGPLPTVEECLDGEVYFVTRPLRVGDRVILANYCPGCKDWFHNGDGTLSSLGRAHPDCNGKGTVPFATATVARIQNHGLGYFVTVTDVEVLS